MVRVPSTAVCLSASSGLVLLLAATGCIPSFPPCDCGKADETGGMAGDYPDFEFLDRSEACADIALPGGGDTGGDETGTDESGTDESGSDETGTGTDGGGSDSGGDEPECGYPAGPYGFEEGSVFENLELFDCDGNAVQIAQYLPQVGLPDVEVRGIVFGVGAGWCMPCAEEAAEWAEHFVDDWPEIQFIQALDEGSVGAATAPICTGWSTANADDKFPILFTPDLNSLKSKIEGQSGAPIPYTLVFDANANVIFKQTGGIVDSGILEIQLNKLLSDPYG